MRGPLPVSTSRTAPCAEGSFPCTGVPGVRIDPSTIQVVKRINCVCGSIVEGDDDDELWENAQRHLRSDHPDLAGNVSREDIVAQAEDI
jgi:hypothetical protein